MKKAFQTHLQTRFSELQNRPFLLACSGGVDSVVLAHLCSEIGLKFALAHCNFKLRGAASSADARFVLALGKQLNTPVFTTSFNTKEYIAQYKVSVQMAARQLRYRWFNALLKDTPYHYLVTAHHRDDTLETMIINLSRGTGIEGLLGIPEKKGAIRRPLLPFNRATILTFAKENNIVWREDASNQDLNYVRNKIRHKILPLLQDLHPNALENMSQTQSYLSQTHALSQWYLINIKKELWQETAGIITISIAPLLAKPALLATLYGLFAPYGFTRAQSILNLCKGETAKKLLSPTYILLKDRAKLKLYQRNNSQNINTQKPTYIITKADKELTSPFFLTITSGNFTSNVLTAQMFLADAALLNYPLCLRHIKNGDVFYPTGMKGKKKLSKFLRDEKINVISRASIWLLTDAQDRIIWVVGLRADRRFVAHEKTIKCICFTKIN